MSTILKKKLSLIINFHNEGFLAHKTIQFAKKLIENTKKNIPLKIDVYAVADKPCEVTQHILLKNKSFFTKIKKVNYGCLAQSRNEALKICKSDYITFLDGDDFYSLNWIIKCIEFTNTNHYQKNMILHPEVVMSFERKFDYFRHIDQESDYFDSSCFLKGNPYSSPTFMHRSVLEKIKYKTQDKKHEFGYEDWLWHCETFNKGYIHKTVSDTIYIYRKKFTNSLLLTGKSVSMTIEPNDLYANTKKLLSKKAKITDHSKLFDTKLNSLQISQIDEISKFDLQLKPVLYLKNSLTNYSVSGYKYINEYVKTLNELNQIKAENLILTNNLNSYKYILSNKKNDKTVLLITNKKEYLSIKKYKSLKYVQLPDRIIKSNSKDKEYFLIRLLLQLKINNIISNDNLSLNLFANYSKKIIKYSNLQLNLITKNKKQTLNLDTYLKIKDILPYIHSIQTNNTNYYKLILKELGYRKIKLLK